MLSSFSALKKRIAAFAVTFAVALSAVGGSLSAYADNENDAVLITEKAVISKACELLGVKYRLGGKGSPDCSKSTVYERSVFEGYGIDCTGLIFWTYCSLGASIKHTSKANKSRNDHIIPIATFFWYDGSYPYYDLQLSVNGRTAPVQILRNKLKSYDIDYFNADGGGYITPGSVVIMRTEDQSDEHGWIYIGYVEGGKVGIKSYLQAKYGITGISDEDIVYIPSEGNHWRIESTARPRYLGCKAQIQQGQSMKYTVEIPVYKTGVVISNRRTSAGGVCTGQVVFRIAGLTADKTDEKTESGGKKE